MHLYIYIVKYSINFQQFSNREIHHFQESLQIKEKTYRIDPVTKWMLETLYKNQNKYIMFKYGKNRMP